MTDESRNVLTFYSRHPISLAQILARLAGSRGNLDALRPEELYPHDQDHYGGIRMVDILAERAGIREGFLVADFCAGLGGPARYLASRFGAIVLGIELNPERARGAADLTRRVGLAGRVRVLRGDVMHTALAPETMDAVISQEALLHVPDKFVALKEAYRVLKRGGRLAFTDWVLHADLSATDAELMWRGMAAQNLQTVRGYRGLLADAGFRDIQDDDLTGEWGPILEQRFAMYRRLGEETRRLGSPSGDAAFYRSYERLVALVRGRILGGARFSAQK